MVTFIAYGGWLSILEISSLSPSKVLPTLLNPDDTWTTLKGHPESAGLAIARIPAPSPSLATWIIDPGVISLAFKIDGCNSTFTHALELKFGEGLVMKERGTFTFVLFAVASPSSADFFFGVPLELALLDIFLYPSSSTSLFLIFYQK
jgi:hypothetical protein